MRVGDLVRVIAKDLRIPHGSLGVLTRVEEREDSQGTTIQYWARMVGSDYSFWFRTEYLEVINVT